MYFLQKIFGLKHFSSLTDTT